MPQVKLMKSMSRLSVRLRLPNRQSSLISRKLSLNSKLNWICWLDSLGSQVIRPKPLSRIKVGVINGPQMVNPFALDAENLDTSLVIAVALLRLIVIDSPCRRP